jgi:outer membrane receptor protein involved in Fe transport
MKRLIVVFAMGLLAPWPCLGQEPAEPAPAEDPIRRNEEHVVVGDGHVTEVTESAAAVSVVSQAKIANAPARSYGDLLRNVPGMNVVQTSARDVNLTSRQGTSTLSNSQLALVDGRSVYLDFFGMILWDMVPTDMEDIEQIEVVRGPASAVWGANALTGAVNIVTRRPRNAVGRRVTLGAGLFGRDAGSLSGADPGQSMTASASWSAAPSDRWSYRLSGGYFASDAMPRPTGRVPLGQHPADPNLRTGGGKYPEFPNQGTGQPRFDLRVDQELAHEGRITYSAGVAGSSGLVHTGIGPFDIQDGSSNGFGRVAFSRGMLRVGAFANFTDVTAPNLLTVDAVTGLPLQLDFDTQTYDLEAANGHLFGQRLLVNYGGNVRRNTFRISIAPGASHRTEMGAYTQVRFDVGRFRLVAGGRVDKFDNIEGPVFSPRLTAMFRPAERHAFRLSYNRAFRAPSVINNSLDEEIKFADFPLGLVDPRFGTTLFPIPTRSVGSDVARTINPAFPDLKEERLTAYEVGYAGRFGGRTTVGVSYYVNDTDDNINFTTTGSAIAAAGLPPYFTSSFPPAGWPLPPIVLDILAQRGIRLPATFAYLNLGPIRNRGVELSLDHSFSRAVSAFANYSWQDDPEPCDGNVWESCEPGPNPFPPEELSYAPTHRFNLGVSVDRPRWLANLSVNHTSDAFWTDVLTPDLHGATPAYTLVNAAVGVKWRGGKVVTSLKGTNLADDDVQQHIFGDILKRSLGAEMRILF